MFSTRSKTGHKSGKWVIWTWLEVEGELNDVVWRWIWSHACGLIKLGCVWVGPYLCGPESRVHRVAGRRSGGHKSRALGWSGRVGCWAAWLG